MAFMSPREFPIRKANSNEMMVGQVHNTPRYPERGGFTSSSKIDTMGWDLERPTSRGSSKGNKKAPN